MSSESVQNAELSKDLYEQVKVEVYTEMQKLVELCLNGHGDKRLLWSIRQARHELLKSLSMRAGVEYPQLLEWLTDQERTVQHTSHQEQQ